MAPGACSVQLAAKVAWKLLVAVAVKPALRKTAMMAGQCESVAGRPRHRTPSTSTVAITDELELDVGLRFERYLSRKECCGRCAMMFECSAWMWMCLDVAAAVQDAWFLLWPLTKGHSTRNLPRRTTHTAIFAVARASGQPQRSELGTVVETFYDIATDSQSR